MCPEPITVQRKSAELYFLRGLYYYYLKMLSKIKKFWNSLLSGHTNSGSLLIRMVLVGRAPACGLQELPEHVRITQCK